MSKTLRGKIKEILNDGCEYTTEDILRKLSYEVYKDELEEVLIRLLSEDRIIQVNNSWSIARA